MSSAAVYKNKIWIKMTSQNTKACNTICDNLSN